MSKTTTKSVVSVTNHFDIFIRFCLHMYYYARGSLYVLTPYIVEKIVKDIRFDASMQWELIV